LQRFFSFKKKFFTEKLIPRMPIANTLVVELPSGTEVGGGVFTRN
jgi:hypothetical protein